MTSAGLATLALCATVPAEQLPVKTYTVADGLPRDNVYKVKQDSRGFLWFCTADGLSRFDGYGFTTLTTTDGLPDRHVNDLLETRDGTIFVATSKGLARLNSGGNSGGSLFSVFLPANPGAREIKMLYETKHGEVFAGTSDGLYRVNGSELVQIELGPPGDGAETLPVTAIAQDTHDAMWIGTVGAGIIRLSTNGVVDRFTKENGLPDVNVSTLHIDRNGRIWVGLSPHLAAGLLLLVEDPESEKSIVERHFEIKDGLPADWITDLFESSDGRFWVGTIRGLCEWQVGADRVCKTYTADNGICDGEVWSIAEDRDQNIWLGSRCGAKRWARYGFTSYSESDGLAGRNPNSIFQNSTGDLFVTFNDGPVRSVSRFENGRFEPVTPQFQGRTKYPGWGWKQTVWQDSSDDWWFPTGSGVFRFKKPSDFKALARTKPEMVETGANQAEVFRLYEDRNRNIWIATIGPFNELFWWERSTDTWRDLTSESGLGNGRYVTAFAEDASGTLWLGTASENDDASLVRYRGGNFRVFDRKDNEFLSGSIRDLFVDHKDRMWIANPDYGLLRLDDLSSDRLNFLRYTPAEGLSTIGVSCVTEDAFGRIYIGTGRGLDRLSPDTGRVQNFTTADGLPDSTVEVGFKDTNGDLWFGTTKGLARFIPQAERVRQQPGIVLTAVKVAGVSKSESILGETTIGELSLDPDQRQISVDFVGVGPSLGEPLRYEYRIGPTDWVSSAERTVNFANLSSGKYTFEVRSQTGDGIYSGPATLTFQIAAPIWQRWWFMTLCVAFTALVIYLIYRNRMMRIVEMERIRTRIATDLHDDIGSNLTRISLMSEVAKQRTTNGAGDLLSSIAEIARESVASMNDIVWAISPDHDSPSDLMRRMRRYVEDVFAIRDVTVAFNGPVSDSALKLSVGVRRDVLLIFKEAVNNAARHSDCSRIEIEFRVDNFRLLLRVHDNGRGMDENEEPEGQGLASMARRAKTLGGDLRVQSTPAKGTSVEFETFLAGLNR